MTDVSIIYVNYHTSDLIADSMRSVYKFTEGVNYEIIVVDNATEPHLRDKFSSLFPGKELKFIFLKENVGFGRANNAGAREAQSRYVFYLNPDTVLVNNAIKILMDYMDSHSDVGAAGGNLYDDYMGPMLSFRRFIPGVEWEINELMHHIPERMRYGKNIRFNFSDNPLEVGYISGADLMVRSEIEKKLGGFSKEFFMYYEETDYCARIRNLGYKVINVPLAKIMHLEGGSFENADVNETRMVRSETSRFVYYRRNVSPFKFKVCNTLYIAFLRSRVLLTRSEGYKIRLRIFKSLLEKYKNKFSDHENTI